MKPFIFLFLISFTSYGFEYFPPENWHPLPAKIKQEKLWEFSNNEVYEDDELPQKYPIEKIFNLFDIDFVTVTLNVPHDIYTAPRDKLIHFFGSVAKVRFKITKPTPYTGLLAEGTDAYGLARLGLANQGIPFLNYTPGMAIKVLVDKRPSVNMLVINSLDGQVNNRNFFAKPLTNVLDPPRNFLLQILSKVFKVAIDLVSPGAVPTNLPTANFAKVDQFGNEIKNYRFPFQIFFQPADVQFDPDDYTDVRIQLKTLTPGTILYRIFAKETEKSEIVEIGELELESEFVASFFEDHWLLFQHNALK